MKTTDILIRIAMKNNQGNLDNLLKKADDIIGTGKASYNPGYGLAVRLETSNQHQKAAELFKMVGDNLGSDQMEHRIECYGFSAVNYEQVGLIKDAANMWEKVAQANINHYIKMDGTFCSYRVLPNIVINIGYAFGKARSKMSKELNQEFWKIGKELESFNADDEDIYYRLRRGFYLAQEESNPKK